jgi:Iron-containing redox enzyme
MNAFEIVKASFHLEQQKFLKSEVIGHLMSGAIGVPHYAQLMRQIFHQARENPQLQALATVRFRGARRDAVGIFYRHAASEIGHDELALADYAACGGNPTPVRTENPHPATSGVTGFAFHQIYNQNPVGYLGYLFFLEFLPTSVGGGMIERLRSAGVPSNAFKFLEDHVTVDVGHNKAMEKYCEILIRDEDDMSSVKYALQATSYLYTKMIEAAVDSVDDMQEYGQGSEEKKAVLPVASHLFK